MEIYVSRKVYIYLMDRCSIDVFQEENAATVRLENFLYKLLFHRVII